MMNQDILFRSIVGAVRNVAHAHPQWGIHPQLARSVAKRAAGTLKARLAVLPEVLAPMASEKVDELLVSSAEASRPGRDSRGRGGRSHVPRPSPLKFLWKTLSWKAGEARAQGKMERYETLIEILRLVHDLQDRR